MERITSAGGLRRYTEGKRTEVEEKIHQAHVAVEKMEWHPDLTKASTLIIEALNIVADYLEKE